MQKSSSGVLSRRIYNETEEMLRVKSVHEICASHSRGIRRITWLRAPCAAMQNRTAMLREHRHVENSVIKLICLSQLDVLGRADLVQRLWKLSVHEESISEVCVSIDFIPKMLNILINNSFLFRFCELWRHQNLFLGRLSIIKKKHSSSKVSSSSSLQFFRSSVRS